MRRKHYRPSDPIACLCREQFGDDFWLPIATSHIPKCSRDAAHHASNERRGDRVDPKLAPHAANVDGEQGSASVRLTRNLLAESAEVVLTDQGSGGQFHRFEIQRPIVFEGEPRLKRIWLGAVDSIAVVPSLRAESGVEFARNSSGLAKPQVRRKQSVDDERPPLGWNGHVGIEVASLAEGVRARIGATRSHDLVILARDLANSFCQYAVNRSVFTLRRPAAEIGSIVGDGQQDASPLSRQVRAQPFRRRRRAEIPCA